MSRPSAAALNPDVTTVDRDRRGRLWARRQGRPVKVPAEVRELVDAGYQLHELWGRRPELGGGIRPCPWYLTGRDVGLDETPRRSWWRRLIHGRGPNGEQP